jgi:hypothetical protein
MPKMNGVMERDASVGCRHWAKWWLRGTLGTMAVALAITVITPRTDNEKGLAWYDQASMSAFSAMCPGMLLGVFLGAVTYRRGLKPTKSVPTAVP